MINCKAWLLDIYDDPQGVTLWFVTAKGKRLALHQPFPVTFYMEDGLHTPAVQRFLDRHPVQAQVEKTTRMDLFDGRLRVLAVTLPSPELFTRLFRQVVRTFPDLTYYDADIRIPLRYAGQTGVFPMAQCAVQYGGGEAVPPGSGAAYMLEALKPIDTPWDIDPVPAPVSSLTIGPNCDPRREQPKWLDVKFEPPAGRATDYRLPFPQERVDPASEDPLPLAYRPLVASVGAIIRRHDPDLLITDWGDTWLLPLVIKGSKQFRLAVPLNRDEHREPKHIKEISYHSYGQVIYRGQQIHLFGRLHIDRSNAVLYGDYGLLGALETARVTGMPLQRAARVSPGSGISSMQILTALRREVLVPYQKQQVEFPKTALELIQVDRGGLVYQPTVGLHRNVLELDFVSMYPAVIVQQNLSPETKTGRKEERVTFDNAPPTIEPPWDDLGLIPATLAPLLGKRIKLKQRLPQIPSWHPNRKRYKAQASAQKWLLVTCFGYLGYKNARFGRIEAHEAVTACGREALLRAKEAAEDLGFEVLHMYVDGLWVKNDAGELAPLMEEIVARTGLPVALEGRYDWVAFLPSRVDPRVPVANRYFGRFSDGRVKMRGIEARWRDTCPFIKNAQIALIEQIPADISDVGAVLPGLFKLVDAWFRQLRSGRVPVEELVIRQKLSRTLEAYRVPSPAARAAMQMASRGTAISPGMSIRFLHTRGEQGVTAWELAGGIRRERIDTARYVTLFVRAMHTVLQPFGVAEDVLERWLFGRAGYGGPAGTVRVEELPLLSSCNYLGIET